EGSGRRAALRWQPGSSANRGVVGIGMLNRRHLVSSLVSALLASVVAKPAFAQTYPTKTIRIIVPFTPGSPVDVAARLLGQHLSVQFGQGVVIDNRPGAGTAIGMRTAVIADPDGHTLLFQSSSL